MSDLVVREDAQLWDQLQRLAAAQRLVFFAGLPGTGKSLLIHQLAHLAHAAGRTVHLLQWDAARPAFEASPAGARYPLVDGVTHGVIRRAIGLWARRAVLAWHRRHPEPRHVLIGETPLVGHRLVELTRPHDDAAEPLLTAVSTRFVIPVPSSQVRQFLEAERERRAARPLHAREREDAPPHVLRDLWRELARVASALGIPAPASVADGPYDPVLYRRVYERLLRHRPAQVLPVDTVLPTGTFSVYAFAVATRTVAPSPTEVADVIGEVAERYPDPEALQREIDRWYVMS